MTRPGAKIEECLRRAGLSSAECLACDVCCRFASPVASFVPFFTNREALDCRLAQPQELALGTGLRPVLAPDGHAWRCPLRSADSQHCTAYQERPLDCRLYPFLLMYDEPGTRVLLGLDEACPFARDHWGEAPFREAADQVARLLEGPLAATIASAPGIVSRFHDHVRKLCGLPALTRRLCRSDLGLARLVSTARPDLAPFFPADGHATPPLARATCLTGHAFPALYLWADLFNLHWRVEADCLLVFAEADGVSFLLAPPLGTGDVPRALRAAAEIMAAINGPRGGARAQEVDEALVPLFQAEGWTLGHQAREYICDTASLVELRGRHFDGRRNDIRRFEAAWGDRVVWRPYAPDDFPRCAALLRRWQRERATSHPDAFYRDQLDAAGFLHLRTLREADELGLRGFVVELQGPEPAAPAERQSPISNLQSSICNPIVAYTFGFPLADGETFADFIEVADLAYRGLAAWAFRQFCREAARWRYINVGTDSELPNLARTKLAYRPARIVTSYTLNAP